MSTGIGLTILLVLGIVVVLCRRRHHATATAAHFRELNNDDKNDTDPEDNEENEEEDKHDVEVASSSNCYSMIRLRPIPDNTWSDENSFWSIHTTW